MKIDPKVQLPSEVQPEAIQNSRKTGVQQQTAAVLPTAVPTAGQDTVSISSTHSDLQTLKVQLDQTPEIRTDRVNALRQQVNNRQYSPSSANIAQAVISEQSILGSSQS
jgi:negative regulator of flagellin synthesis FlgM